MRISGVYGHQMLQTEELFTGGVVNNNKTLFYLLLLN